MKLLLTSNGLDNDSIAQAFQDLVGKVPKDTKVAFIPTAANPKRSDKTWLVDDMHKITKRGYYLDFIELTAIKPEDLQQTLEPFDAIFVGGGHTLYLSYWMQKSGFTEILPELLKTKVYASISAGTIVAGKSIAMASQVLENPEAFQKKEYDAIGPKGESSGEALGLVDFVVRPHLNRRYFSTSRKDLLEEKAKIINAPVYAIDDETALKVVDGNIEVISEGEWLVFNND